MPALPTTQHPDRQEAVETPFTTFDGRTLAVFDWPLPDNQPVRGVVLMVHGLGEHAWRYNTLATELVQAGFVVRAYDQRGHGDSWGHRGCLPHADTLLRDLTELLEDTQTTLCERLRSPLVLLGHSMGALVAALWVARNQTSGPLPALGVDALVLSSPALSVPLTPWQSLLLGVLPSWLPRFTVHNGIDPALLSHDPDATEAYLNDPRIHHRVSPRLARFIVQAGPEVLRQVPHWRVPTLLLYAGLDALVDPAGSRFMARRAPPGIVTAQCFEGFLHDVLHEQERHLAVDALLNWLWRRF